MSSSALCVLDGSELDPLEPYFEPPAQARVQFHDVDLLPRQTLRAKIMRMNEKGEWIKTGHGTVFMYYDSTRGLGRIKALDERKVPKIHAYVGAGHPIGRHKDNENAFVVKLWSSTLTYKRALFCLVFDTDIEAHLFRVLFDIATDLAHDHMLREISFAPDKDQLEKEDKLLKAGTKEETNDKVEDDLNEKDFKEGVKEEDEEVEEDEDEDEEAATDDDNDYNKNILPYMVDESQNPFGIDLKL